MFHLVLAHPGSPRQKAVKWLCVFVVCGYICIYLCSGRLTKRLPVVNISSKNMNENRENVNSSLYVYSLFVSLFVSVIVSLFVSVFVFLPVSLCVSVCFCDCVSLRVCVCVSPCLSLFLCFWFAVRHALLSLPSVL